MTSAPNVDRTTQGERDTRRTVTDPEGRGVRLCRQDLLSGFAQRRPKRRDEPRDVAVRPGRRLEWKHVTGAARHMDLGALMRSEERRVGKEGRSGERGGDCKETG